MHHGQRRALCTGFLEKQRCFELLEDRQLLATDLLSLVDSQIPFSSRPKEFLAAGDYAFFQADFSLEGGNQLWRTDGTHEGTISLAHEGLIREYVEIDGSFVWLADDQTIRASDGTPQGTTILAPQSTLGEVSTQLVKHGEYAFFAGEDEGLTLYRTDGTRAGTQLFADLSSIGAVHRHQLMGGLGDFFYLNVLVRPQSANVEIAQLWRTDGTAAGTELVSADHRFEGIGPVVELNGTLLFAANLIPPANGVTKGTDRELWMVSTEGVELLKEIAPGPDGTSNDPSPAASSYPAEMVIGGDTVYFTAVEPMHGRELWSTDGTVDGTVLVVDVTPGPAGSDPTWLTWYDDRLLFSARGELWSYDPSLETSQMVRDFNASDLSLGPAWLTTYRDHVIFTADDGQGDEVWITNGTPSGTKLLKETASGSVSGDPTWFTVLGDRLVFSARSPDAGVELWTTDGTSAGTQLVRDVRTGNQQTFLVPGGLVEFNDMLYFRLHDPEHGAELWRSDGTAEGTELFMEIRPNQLGSGPREFFEYGDYLYFSADDGQHGRELWRTDGTRRGTEMVSDIWPGVDGSVPSDFFAFGDDLYFTANDAEHGRELWRKSGNAGLSLIPEPIPGSADSAIRELTVTGSGLFFVAKNLEPQSEEALWFLDESADAPIRLGNQLIPQHSGGLTAFGQELMFREITSSRFRRGLYLTDGTAEGTRSLNPSPLPQTPAAVAPTTLAFDGFLFDIVDGGTLLRIDPSQNVSEEIESNVTHFRRSGGLLFVAFADGRLGVLKQGSIPITMIADLAPANITKLVPHETGVFVETWSSEVESPVVNIWSSDGTSSGTRKLLENSEFSSINELKSAVNSLVFVGSHTRLGDRIWVTPFPVVGDVNGDMIANQDDIDAIFAAVRDGSGEGRFDLNQDGAVTGDDATYLIETILDTRPGDLDLNGRVEFADFLRLGGGFGSDDASWTEGDLNGDTTVDFDDFLALTANFGFDRRKR